MTSIDEPRQVIDSLQVQTHRQTLKDIQKRIQKAKNEIKSTNKSERKLVEAELCKLESEKERLHNRIKELEESNHSNSSIIKIVNQTHRKTRKQSNWEKLEKEREELRLEFESSGLISDFVLEDNALMQQLDSLSLAIVSIPSDGNCLYHALAHQINSHPVLSSKQSSLLENNQVSIPIHILLRRRIAEFILKHQQEFSPFIYDEFGDTTGKPSEELVKDYCDRIISSNTWGGHLEIQAACNILKTPIWIYQANQPLIKFSSSEEDQNEPIRLSYHHKEFGLGGEHYNSIVKYVRDQ